MHDGLGEADSLEHPFGKFFHGFILGMIHPNEGQDLIDPRRNQPAIELG